MATKKNSNNKASIPKGELKAVREVLLKKKAEILEEIMKINGQHLNKTAKDASGDLSGYTIHMADMATDLYDREFSLELAEGEREMLYAFDEALKRVDNGTYGKCDECESKIPKARLKAMPQATLCIKCQEQEEKDTGR